MAFKINQEILDDLFLRYNRIEFIEKDPISLPHQYTKKQDIEIVAFWTAILSWGQRTTIIKKAKELFSLMDNAPSDFIKNHYPKDRIAFDNFKHRTFNAVDTDYFLTFLQNHYQKNESLETAFADFILPNDIDIENALKGFYRYFIDNKNFPARTAKHISTPEKNSACKRLCMFLRWMVRNDSLGVDFGLWKKILPSQLICPFDVHVERIAREWNLVERKKADWKTAKELTENLRLFSADDPVKYDFALFGWGVENK
ncbi:MAG: TIGR02757 family protein [Bacteroidetes bacterium]|nr:MAG: TIGR02757 family protein [Bacteroidota bacterium]TAG90420.1 MAG: TIGR02757 family protein [Bacteroidota bacterium]